MSRRAPRLWIPVLCTALATLAISLVGFSTAYADSKPFFRILEGDIFAGGWFNDNTNSCAASSSYQGPTYGPISDQYQGAIMGFAEVNGASRTGASSTMGAFATGLIEGSDSASTLDYGFYSGLAGQGPAPPGSRALNFANIDDFSQGNAFWGGTFEGADLKAHCILDYYNTKQTDIQGAWTGSYSTNGQFTSSGGSVSGGTVTPGSKLTVFVNGDILISSNIVYGPHNMTNIPKFTLVALGNIYVHPEVSRLDGWYIAQPTSTGGGEIWTCRQSNSAVPNDVFIRNNCNSSLTINGGLTAKQINLSRISGGLSGDAAETINFSPNLILGGPFLEDETPETAGTIQSLISLPPVF